jgi:hypothetical protein
MATVTIATVKAISKKFYHKHAIHGLTKMISFAAKRPNERTATDEKDTTGDD